MRCVKGDLKARAWESEVVPSSLMLAYCDSESSEAFGNR